MLKELLDSIIRIFFGHNAVDNVKDLSNAHNKAIKSRKEVNDIIAKHKNQQ